jgi:selenocysteine-specific elongation factor
MVKNDRFIVRQPSPGATIGGGVVVNVHPRRRYRRFRPEVITRLETMAHGDPEEVLLQSLESQQPCEARELIKRCGLPAEEAAEALNALLSEGQIIIVSGQRPAATIQQPAASSQYLISRSGWQSLIKDLSAVLRDYHQQHPLRRGMSREELKSRSRLASRLFNEVVGLAAREGKLVEEETTIRLPQHEVKFRSAEQRKVDALLAEFRRNPYTTPSVTDCEAQVGVEVLNALIEQGRLIKVSEDVIFLTETYEEMVNRIVARIKGEGSITVAQARDMFGASRKYALGLMEHLDERRVTKRVGDKRVLR